MGIMLRLLVMVNVLCLAAAMVRAENLADLGSRFMTISVIAQPALILSLIATCLLRPVFLKLAYWQGIVLILLMEGAVGALMWAFFDALAALSQPIAWWQYVFFFAFVTGSVLVYFDLRSRALSPALAEARLQALQARIRPHFLFNSINAVLSLIRSEPKRAERMLEDMAELFRVLMADNRQLVPLADEIALCRRFLDIEQIRLGERLQVNWRIDAMPRDALVPPLILQPLIENAVYHGIEPASGVGELNIHIEPKGKQLVIRMTNPYQAGSTHATGNRMAIANIKERLQLHFDAEASLKADVSGDRYLVTITLPTVEKTP
ncbi:MAG: histidine kinase [Betaproteobacteria bacterium]|nr:histidine kinase [Betaproteobacteria bacterium]